MLSPDLRAMLEQRQALDEWDRDGEYMVAARRMRAEQRALKAAKEAPVRARVGLAATSRQSPPLPSARAAEAVQRLRVTFDAHPSR